MEDKPKKKDLTVIDAQKPGDEPAANGSEEDLFSFEEITLEEMAIDGICGVY